jgi:hypothetical protein
MNRSNNLKKLFTKDKKKDFYNDKISFNEIKRNNKKRKYRNYNNALRSKNLDRLLSYDDN